MNIASYHDATGAYHQKQFEPGGLSKKGYRPISLSVYGDPHDPLYAAVWSTSAGPAWVAIHGASGSQYQDFYNTWHPQGYHPVIVTATGGGTVGNQSSNPVYAGVFHKGTPDVAASHGISSASFKTKCDDAKKGGSILRWGTIYGGKDRLYAGVWEKLPGSITWDWKITLAFDGSELGVPVQHPENPSLRLSFVTRSPFAEYLAVYRSDQAANVKERHGMTSSEYQTQHDTLKQQGYYPVCVQAGADPRVNDVPRFVAIFQKF